MAQPIGTLYVHDPRAVLVVFAGIVINELIADDFVTIERPEGYTWKPSATGGGARSATNDTSASVKLKLLQGSKHNAQLEAQYAQDRSAKNGAGVGALSIRDSNGVELYTAAKAWIEKPADAEFAKEAGEREWTLRVADLTAGGTTPL